MKIIYSVCLPRSCSLAPYTCNRRMPRYRCNQYRDFLFRLARTDGRKNGDRNGVIARGFMVPDEKSVGKKDGERSVEHANAAIGFSIR